MPKPSSAPKWTASWTTAPSARPCPPGGVPAFTASPTSSSRTSANAAFSSPPAAVATETKGEWPIADRDFILSGVADRIERLPDGTLAILDYKTGTVPTQKSITNGFDSQLVLEAAMAEGGAFGPEFTGPAADLAYWRLTGGQPAGEIIRIYKKQADDIQQKVADAYGSLDALILRYDDPTQPYLSEPHPETKPRFSNYAQLARVAEWSIAEDD